MPRLALLLYLLLALTVPAAAQRNPRRPRPPLRKAPVTQPATPPGPCSALLPGLLPPEAATADASWKPVAPPILPTPPDEIVFSAVGDMMLGSTFPDTTGASLPPNDGATLLAEVTPILASADIAFGNLEGPMLEGGTSAKCEGREPGTCYAFRVPSRYGIYLKTAGFDVMGLANNHATDFGPEGRASTRHVLDCLGIQHSGEVGDVAYMSVKDKKVALVDFTTYDAFYDLRDLAAVRQTVADLTARADMVLVSFHGGAEGAAYQHVPSGDEKFLGEDRGDLRAFAHAAIDSGAKLVFGHGPHVVRGMEIYKDRLIAYSLGNFATFGTFNLQGPNGLSLILETHLGLDGAFHAAIIHPIKQEKPGGPHLDPNRAILPLLRDLSERDFGAASPEITGEGRLLLHPSSPPAVPGP